LVYSTLKEKDKKNNILELAAIKTDLNCIQYISDHYIDKFKDQSIDYPILKFEDKINLQIAIFTLLLYKNWSILEKYICQRSTIDKLSNIILELGKKIVTKNVKIFLKTVPVAEFGDIITADL